MGIGGFLWRVTVLAFLVGLAIGIYLGYHAGITVEVPAVAAVAAVVGRV